MARIPDQYSLSQQPGLRSGRQIAQGADVSGLTRGLQNLAQGVENLGSSFVVADKEKLAQQNAVDIATAEAHKTKSLLDIQNRAELDPDYSTLGPRYNKEVQDATNQSANVIRDPKMRARYAATQQEAIVRAQDFITDLSTKKSRDANVVALDDANKKNYDLVIDPNTPDPVREKARADIAANIDTNLKTGLLSPEEAQKRRDIFVQGAYDQQALLAAESGNLNLPDVDALTNAMIGVESEGDPTAESPKGASGLMQVMPETAAGIAKELGDPNFPADPAAQKEYLKNRDVSLMYGKKYMSDMLIKYKGDEEAALIAYNGGPGRADAWLKAGRDDSVLPQETADYYKKVLDRTGPKGQQTTFDPTQVSAARTYLQAHTDKDASHIDGLQGNFAVKVANLLQNAPPEIRDQLGVFSGRRTYAKQAELWSAALVKYGSPEAARKNVAPPGHSNHETGNAADLSYKGKSLKDAPPEVVNWLHQNAGKYGLKFPLGNENWHIEDESTRKGALKSYPKGWDKVSPEMRQRAFQVSAAKQQELYRQQVAETTIIRQQTKDNYNLQIALDPVKVSQNDILNDQNIDNGDKASLINTLNGALKENQGVSDLIGALASGRSIPINNFDDKETGTADKAYDKLVASAPEDQRPLVTSAFIAQTGRVPKSFQADIRQGMATNSIPQMTATLQTVDKLDQIAPTAIGTMEGASQVQKNLTAYRHFAFDMGYSPEEAARKIVALNDPAMATQREAIMKTKGVTDFIKGVDSSTVSGIFDTAFSFAPKLGDVPTQQALSVGYTPESEAAIVADYKGILEESIADAGGDTTLGKKMADERFGKIYGTSDLTMAGTRSVIKLPPEKAYPADVNGSHDYIREQAIEDLKAEKIDATEVFLQPYDQTERDVAAGKPANYQLFYMQDGKLQKYQHPFTADPSKADKTSLKKSEEGFKANRAQAVADDKFYNEIRAARDAAAQEFKDYPDVYRSQKMREAEQKVRDQHADQ